jgi:hypothetical protein
MALRTPQSWDFQFLPSSRPTQNHPQPAERKHPGEHSCDTIHNSVTHLCVNRNLAASLARAAAGLPTPHHKSPSRSEALVILLKTPSTPRLARARAALCACFLLCCAFSGAALAQAGQQALRINLDVARSSQSPDASLTLNVSFTNQHPQRRVVLRGELGFGRHGGVEVEITDPSGAKRMLPATLGDFTLTEQDRNERAVFVMPGEGVGLVRRFRASEIRTVPGTYAIQVLYRSPMPTSANARAQGRPDDVEGSAMVSNVVEIELN